MKQHRSLSLTVGCAVFFAMAPKSMGQISDSNDEENARTNPVRQFLLAQPGAAVHVDNERVTRVYGQAFANGNSPQQSVQQFLDQHAAVFKAQSVDLVPTALPGGQHAQPIMYQPETGTYKFTGLYFNQVRSGVPVFRSRLVALVRNESGYPLVLASADVRDLGNYQLDPAATPVVVDEARVTQTAQQLYGPQAQVIDSKMVIWAGVEGQSEPPRLAEESYIVNGDDEWVIVTDAASGATIYQEYMICFGGITGNVSGRATEGVGAEQCEDEPTTPLPYIEVDNGTETVFTDVNGNFALPSNGGGTQMIDVMLRGMWFNVFNSGGGDTSQSTDVEVPGTASLLFNGFNNDELVRSEVNGYLHANVVRDYVLNFNPLYPTLNNTGFPVNVNNVGGLCPGNAWYSPGEQSINFCQSGGSVPNTAWSSVVYHEYGHHLVAAGGSGQGAYGEGMGDVISALVLDDPRIGYGFFGDCTGSLRNADNGCQLSGNCSTCGSESHACGNLISGCVWSTRNYLAETNPDSYLEIISNLAVNSILLHNGSSIDPSITIDYLTLDDDNGNIFDGTPHYTEINLGFSDHSMPAPELASIAFTFPQGLPELVSPFGDGTVLVNVDDVTETAEPGTGILHVSTTGPAGPFTEFPMTELAPNEYQGTFPAVDCGTQLAYFFSAEAVGGEVSNWPLDAPATTFSVVAATNSAATFEDDFETDQGWTVQNDAGLSDGQWERGTPIGGGDRGDPPVDADGSSQCFLTDNEDGNSDVDGGSTTLTSPVMDASGAAPYVSYNRWYSNVEGDSPLSDVFVVEVSDDGGSSWVLLEEVGPASQEVFGGWFFKQFDLSQLDGFELNDQFRIRFTASDLGSGSVVEAGVDGVELRSFTCEMTETCSGDTDDNGVVDVQDLISLIVAWGTDDAMADLNDDGIVNVEDLVALIVAWGPCPE